MDLWFCQCSGGGRIFIGKDDDGNVVGIKKTKKLLKDIPNECKQHGTYPPIFNYEPSGLMLLFKEIIPDSQDKATPETIQKSSLKIVVCMQKDKNITIPEIAKQIGITERGVKKQISKLKADGKIKRIGPDKGGYWEVIK